jgi:hypothetical protein
VEIDMATSDHWIMPEQCSTGAHGMVPRARGSRSVVWELALLVVTELCLRGLVSLEPVHRATLHARKDDVQL